MPVVARGSAPFDLKSTSLSGLALVLRTADIAALADAMSDRFGADADVFGHEPVVIDLSGLAGDRADLDFASLVALLRAHGLLAAGVRGASESQVASALAAGLGDVGDDVSAPAVRREAVAEPVPEPVAYSVSVQAEAEAPVEPVQGTPASPPTEPTPDAPPGVATLIVDKPLRSGQQVYAKGGDLVVLATVNVGAEVIADGNIHVYGPLRGKAVAGAKGNVDARIFSTCMEPQLLAIAGTYRTTENPLPPDVLGKPAQIRLDGERLVFEPLE